MVAAHLIFARFGIAKGNMEGTIIQTADPRAEYRALHEEIDVAIRSVLEGPSYVLGDAVRRFEEEFAGHVGVSHGIGVNNGTDAIHLALRALEIGTGDEVITVSHTAVATVAAICMAGATPVLADVDPVSRTLDPDWVKGLITARTKAVLPVHLYGHPADMAGLTKICADHGLSMVEDCAQAHGARFHGQRVGRFGVLSTFSFYPTKNLGAIGDAGLVATNDASLAERLRMLRQYGWERPQFSEIQGWNSRMDPLQAAILSVKLKHLDARTERRRVIAETYNIRLRDLPLVLPAEGSGCFHVYHLYVVELPDEATRNALRDHLARSGINAGIHYPYAVHQQPAYQPWIRTSAMVITERLASTVLSLPLYPDLTDHEIHRVCDAVCTFYGSLE